MTRKLKYGLLKILRRCGLSVTPSRCAPDLLDFVRNRQIDVILDVGANSGQFGSTMRLLGYKGKIVSFEPVKAAFRQLEATADGDSQWEVRNCALGSTPGTSHINVSHLSVFSSLLPTLPAAAEFDNRSSVAYTEEIEIRTLDETLRCADGRFLLKIDTQGYEKEVLKGALESLSRMSGILMELPIVQLYEGTWKFHEAIEFLASLGFIPAQIVPVAHDPKDGVSLVEADCLFRPITG